MNAGPYNKRVDGLHLDIEPFIARVRRRQQAGGEHWITRLPLLISMLEQQWQIRIDRPFPTARLHYVAPAHRADQTFVVKIFFPTEEFANERATLLHYHGEGAIQLVCSDADCQALLLERVIPGTSAVTVTEAQAVEAFLTVAPKLWHPPAGTYRYPTVGDWGTGLDQFLERAAHEPCNLPLPLIIAARDTFQQLIASTSQVVVLHGDLHHGNIARSQRDFWLAIDPKGVLGDPAYECGAFLRNPSRISRVPDFKQRLAWRVEQLSTRLHLPQQRIWQWAFAQAVLSQWWEVEERPKLTLREVAFITALAERAEVV
ncbi:MAG: aminoglycoside phosphotransferase family protein [Chloroflexi bacterium]|nr:aminoglycoside phosphotransferase family protein [Chloroflexota bacterium]